MWVCIPDSGECLSREVGIQMLDHQLRTFDAHVFVDGQPVGEAGAVAGLGAEIELDGVDAGVTFAQAEFEVFVLEHALLFDLEIVHE